MSTQKFCDVCNGPLNGIHKRIMASIRSPSGKHLANVALTMNTATGAEHVCIQCQIKAINEAISERLPKKAHS